MFTSSGGPSISANAHRPQAVLLTARTQRFRAVALATFSAWRSLLAPARGFSELMIGLPVTTCLTIVSNLYALGSHASRGPGEYSPPPGTAPPKPPWARAYLSRGLTESPVSPRSERSLSLTSRRYLLDYPRTPRVRPATWAHWIMRNTRQNRNFSISPGPSACLHAASVRPRVRESGPAPIRRPVVEICGTMREVWRPRWR